VASTVELKAPPRPAPPIAERRTPPIKAWAVVGALFLVFEVYLLAAWVLSGDFKATPTGPTPMPGWMEWTTVAGQILSPIAAAVFVYFFLIRQWRRAGHITLDGLCCGVFATLIWQDSIQNYTQVIATYNTHLVNFGSWNRWIPGWISPHGNLMAEPVLFTFPVYLWGIWGWAILVNWFMRRCKARYPLIGTYGLVAATFSFACFTDVVAEPLFMRLGFWSYPGSISWLTLFPGHYYQLPLHEIVLWSATLTAYACLRYYKNDHGETWAERGLGELRGSPRQKTGMRFLALTGLCNVILIVCFDIPVQVFGAHQSAWPRDVVNRSYLTDGFCGPGTTYQCFGPGVPMPRRDSARIGHDGELVPAGSPRTAK